MKPTEIIEYQWPYLMSFLDVDEPLDESAKKYGALIRKRRIDSADKLLRLALVYGFCGLSLRQTAAWAEASDVASLSDVALMKRLRKASDWLGHLVATKLAKRSSLASKYPLRLLLVDASTVSAPGNTSTDWKIHLGFDLGSIWRRHLFTQVKQRFLDLVDRLVSLVAGLDGFPAAIVLGCAALGVLYHALDIGFVQVGAGCDDGLLFTACGLGLGATLNADARSAQLCHSCRRFDPCEPWVRDINW